jgi:carboxyl-terminal processing protease
LGCANDVAKEILLLKKDGIEGLVIDLRNNGGGSIKEAIELSGLFIDEGPMSIYKPKAGKPYLLKDMNRGTVFDGPVVILVNSLSASASEFFSGCMQDYGRAVVIGDVTYGKGTAQAIYPVDTVLSSKGISKNGSLKITSAKF